MLKSNGLVLMLKDVYKRQTVYLAGITSVLALLEPVSVSIQNKFGWTRNKTVTVLCIVGGACSMIYATAMGSYILGIADTFLNQIALLIGVCLLYTSF